MTPTSNVVIEPDDFLAEVAAYDREAEVADWPGPRYKVRYRILGGGPPLFLIPGLASTYRGYAATLRVLARTFRTIQLEYPGEEPGDGADLGSVGHDQLVDDLIGLADHLQVGRAVLFGLSFGSTIALKALHRTPGRFPKAALQGGFARRGMALAERMALALGRRFTGDLSRLPFHARALARRNRATFPSDRPELWDYYVEQNGLTPIAGIAHRLVLMGGLDLRPILPEIEPKVVLIHGTLDEVVPMRYHLELAAGLKNGVPLLMPRVGHQPHFTHPAMLATLVRGFLTG